MARRLAALVVLMVALSAGQAHAATYDFAVSPNPPVVGQETTFAFQGDTEDVDRVRWDLDGDDEFDDGELDDSDGFKVTYTYTSEGPHTVRMRVTEEDNDREIVEKTITVNAGPTVNAAPTAGFSYAPGAPSAGDTVSFASTSTDPDGDAIALSWSFGDGATSGAQAPSHVYTAPGSYTVTLTATDEHGATAFSVQTVTISEGPGLNAPPITQLPVAGRPVRMRPFPVIRIAGVVLPRGAKVRVLSVRAPRGARIRARCRGRGCPVAALARTSATGLVRLRRFERTLPAGISIEIFVRKPGRIGKYTRFAIRAGKPPARVDRCLMPGRARPVSCQ